MELIAFFTTISYIIIITEARGPHHPRGERRHVHVKPSDKLTHDVEVLHDRAHIEEHLEEIVPKPDLSKMTDEELERYYFMLHDTDKNSKLDGLEILNSMLHTIHDDNKEEESRSNEIGTRDEELDFDEFLKLVEKILTEDDKNKDGYISYPEYADGISKKKANDSQQRVQIVN